VLKRASDADRERCLQDLRASYAAGRIDERELERRAGCAVRASMRMELWALTLDLPRTRAPRWVGAAERVDRALLRAHTGTFTAANGSLVGVWAIAGAGSFWPAIVLVPWTPLLAWHAWGSRAVRRRLRRRRGALTAG
jgi:hypothetical protein